MTASSVMSSQVKPAAVIRASSPSKLSRAPALDPEQHRAEVARRLLQVLEAGDVVVRAEHREELAQRPGPLRQPQDVVLLPPLPAQRPLLDVGQPLEVEVAARDDRDDRAARERPEVAQRVDGERPGRLEHHPLDVQHLDHGGADPVLRRQQHVGRREAAAAPRSCRSPIRATAAPSTKLSTCAQRHRLARLERPPQARRRRPARRAGRASPGASAVGDLHHPGRRARRRRPARPGRRAARAAARGSRARSVACPSITSASSNGGRNSAPASAAKRLRRGEGRVEIVADQPDLDPPAAELPGLVDLLLRRRHRHEDDALDAEVPAGKGHALRVVAGRGADEAPPARAARQRLAHGVERAADLVGADRASGPRASARPRRRCARDR